MSVALATLLKTTLPALGAFLKEWFAGINDHPHFGSRQITFVLRIIFLVVIAVLYFLLQYTGDLETRYTKNLAELAKLQQSQSGITEQLKAYEQLKAEHATLKLSAQECKSKLQALQLDLVRTQGVIAQLTEREARCQQDLAVSNATPKPKADKSETIDRTDLSNRLKSLND